MNFFLHLEVETCPDASLQIVDHLPNLTGLNRQLIPFLKQARLLSSCTNEVLVPFSETPIPNPDEPANSGQTFVDQANRGLVGLSGESRLSDGNNSFFHTAAVPPPVQVRPAPPPDGGDQPPARRPDVPCETQEPPNLNAPGGPASSFVTEDTNIDVKIPLVKWNGKKLMEAGRVYKQWDRTVGAKRRAAALKRFKALGKKGASE